jgi:hypothetical protein
MPLPEGNYQLAVNLLEKAWQEQRDPETCPPRSCNLNVE